MGANCASSFLKNNYQVVIAGRSSTSKIAAIGEIGQTIQTHRLSETSQYLLIIPSDGFFSILSGMQIHQSLFETSQQNDKNLLLHFQRNPKESLKIEVIDNRANKNKIWKKLPNPIIYLAEQDELLINNIHWKLKFWLSRKQIAPHWKKIEGLLKTCKDPQAECRICSQQQTTIQNPLLQPCSCKGSTRYLHDKCLQKWIFGNSAPASPEMQKQAFKIIIEHYFCEICLRPFEEYIYSKILRILAQFESNYAIFKLRKSDKEKQISTFFLVFKFESNQRYPQTIVIPPSFYLNQNQFLQNLSLELTKKQDGTLILQRITKETKNMIDISKKVYLLNKSQYLFLNEEYLIDDFEVKFRKSQQIKQKSK